MAKIVIADTDISQCILPCCSIGVVQDIAVCNQLKLGERTPKVLYILVNVNKFHGPILFKT